MTVAPALVPARRRPARLRALVPPTVVALAAALLGVVPAAQVARAADTPVPSSVTLVGSLQSELGCSVDWQPDCAATHLARVGDSTTFTGRFTVPAGSYELKVALDDSWDESHGQDGGSANIPLVLAGPATLEVSYDHGTHRVGLAPTDLPGPVTAADEALARPSLREPLTRERYYFVMADRFANGDRGNDAGGLTGGRLETGLDPAAKGFYHGGDLKGLTSRLDYIKDLGTTAIWLTPSFKNRPVQGSGADASAGYHGYWITDFTQVDPHLGTNADLKRLIDRAHAKGMKVFFDIITNHTADVIDNAQRQYSYVSKDAVPYRDADGTVFDDKAYAGKSTFPRLDPATSFPRTPVFRTEADRTVKVPAWLNDPTRYHNRGDSTFAGESAEYGDFAGLDDLFTEQPAVVDGMTRIYQSWVDFGIDGFRIDTVKHVNMEFWQSFSPAMLARAKADGKKDFFMFGEVYDARPSTMSQYTTTGRLPATLDFGFQAAAQKFATGGPTTGVRDLFADDDYYTDTDSNAYELPTFLGNHDMGRIGYLLRSSGVSDPADLARRDVLAHQLMYLTRGQPVVYYGDEQGFVGTGGDQLARQDMFASKVPEYNADDVIGGTPGSRDRYSEAAPMYRAIKALADLRAANPALADGTQVHRYASSSAGIYAFSRVDRTSKVEYLVAANNATTAKTVDVATFSRRGRLTPLLGSGTTLRTDAEGRTSLTVPPLSVAVWRATRPVDARESAPPVYAASPQPGAVVAGRAEVGVSVPANALAEVTFAYRPVGTSRWQRLGTDDNAPYRVFHDTTALAKGTMVEYRAVLRDSSGNYSATSTYAVVGDPAPAAGGDGGGGGLGPVEQPASVSVPGSHNSEMGCAGDWAPDCDQAQLTLDPADRVWKGTYTLPAAPYAYKAAIDKGWAENYGAGGVKDGPNVEYTAPSGPVTFYYDHATHYVTSDAQGPIVTAPGSFQSELGCAADWSPACMRPWLQDPDGDGVYTWRTDQIPAGSYEVKAAHGLSFDENYGAGGARDGANIAFTVPGDGVVTTFSYTLATHVLTVSTSRAGAAPDLTRAKAHWVTRDVIAWPATALPAGTTPQRLRWRLHWSPTGGLAVDDEAVTGGSSAALVYDPAGLPASVTSRFPQLTGYLALRLDRRAGATARQALRGQLAVAQYDATGRLTDATGVQVPGVIDDLYGQAAQSAPLGVTWRGATPSLAVWAPTAQDVDALVWLPGREGGEPQRVQLERSDDGVWSARGRRGWAGAEYLYDVTVYAPTTGTVEHNQVTDPYSLALTTNSQRSVVADLSARALRPRQWATTPSPRLAQAVDTTIYELHVRDFSISDPTVPAAHRGTYLAFADEGDGTRHLRTLARAGMNTVHLLPTFDISSIEERRAAQQTPACDLAALAPDSDQQQACVGAVADRDGYNWGYDPYHFMAPEGSYATDPEGTARVREFRTMVGALHADGLRVVLDQVFNHTSASGQAPTSVLDRVVPGYYQRLNPTTGAVETSTCCQNVATEHLMAQKLMVDAVVTWAREYRVDGFRFDLMGHSSRDNMLAVRHALDALTLRRDGVDGRSIYLYGEGWNFGEVADNARFHQATQGQLGGTGIGTFNDRLRDGVRGGGPFDDDPRVQGLGTGLAGAPNGSPANGDAAAQATALAHATDLVELGMAGNLRAYTFRASSGAVVRGDQVDYNGQPAGYADQPDEVVNYVDAHDNETLWDALTLKLPQRTPMADRVRMNTVSLATTALGQSPSFWHAGTDLLRSKSLDRNSFNSGDWFNRLDWTGADNGFGHGLPPKADNEAKWPYLRPLLADASLKPTVADVATATAAAQDLLRLRSSSRLLRLGSAALIEQKLTFPASGTPSARPGVVVMRVDDTVGPDVDPALRGLVVVVNAGATAVTQPVPGLAGHALALSPVQAGGSDPVVKAAGWDAATGTATVPARTVAVLVER